MLFHVLSLYLIIAFCFLLDETLSYLDRNISCRDIILAFFKFEVSLYNISSGLAIRNIKFKLKVADLFKSTKDVQNYICAKNE